MDKKIGILGSGQLSQMMVQASRRLNLRSKLRVLAGSEKDSAALEKNVELVIGNASDRQVLEKFFDGLDVVGFESELIDIPPGAAPGKVRFIPELRIMSLLSEKLEQKKLLRSLGIPSAPFEICPEKSELFEGWLSELRKKWGSFVLKWSKFGYDGRGVIVIDAEVSLADAKAVLLAAQAKKTTVYAEPKVPFARELAIIAVKSPTEFKTYPLVISEQRKGTCYLVTGPARNHGVNPDFEKKAVEYAKTLATGVGLEGTFAIEMFETAEGALWVNEIAPRVHNSGHFSQDACAHDQFEMHLRVLSGMELPDLECTASFAMLNLLGPEGVKGRFSGLAGKLPKPPKGVVLHWYGKEDVFSGRKLGHVNSPGGDVAALKKYETMWIEFLKGLQT